MPCTVRDSLVLLHNDAVRSNKLDLAEIYRHSIARMGEEQIMRAIQVAAIYRVRARLFARLVARGKQQD